MANKGFPGNPSPLGKPSATKRDTAFNVKQVGSAWARESNGPEYGQKSAGGGGVKAGSRPSNGPAYTRETNGTEYKCDKC